VTRKTRRRRRTLERKKETTTTFVAEVGFLAAMAHAWKRARGTFFL